MAKIKVLGSSSAGNGYVIETEEDVLVLECGVPLREALRAVFYNTSKVSGVLVSHSHGDHARYLEEYKSRFGTVLSSMDGNIIPCRWVGVGSFRVMAFECKHDVLNYGYIIQHKEFGTILFGTDTYAYPTIYKGIDHYMVEANYSDELIETLEPVRKNRLLVSHMSLDYAVKYLHECDAEKAQTITLIHLSSGNSNESAFKKRVQREFGVPTYIADKGKVIDITKH